MNNPQLRLTVYRESVGLPRLRWPCGDAEASSSLPQRAEADEWHEEIYSWAFRGGEQVVSVLSSKLVQEFSEGVPRANRRPARLREVALAMREQLSGEWSASMESREVVEDELAPAMVNASAALAEHLR
jgi:hypothetical protein